jgi:hypothetical protein
MVAVSIGERMNIENWEQVLKFAYEINNEGIKYCATLFGINNWEEICAKKQHKELTLDNILSLKLILINFENNETYKINSNFINFFNLFNFKELFNNYFNYFYYIRFLLLLIVLLGIIRLF